MQKIESFWRHGSIHGNSIPDQDSYTSAVNRTVLLHGQNNIIVVGQENIPNGEPLVIAASHRGEGDPVSTAHAFMQTGCVRFVAKHTLVRMPYLGKKIFGGWGSIPVNRSNPSPDTLHESIRTLFFQTNPYLGIFPEGGIKRGNKIHILHQGVGLIACFGKARIIPVGIAGKTPMFRRPIALVIGQPVDYEDLDNEYSETCFRRSPSDKKKIQIVTEMTREAIQEVFDEAHKLI